MKKITVAVWISCVILALVHLLYLAAFDLKPGFWAFTAFLMACYSLPFFWLTKLRMPETGVFEKYATLGVFIFILAVNIFIPVRRYFPGYRPGALESLVYLFVPLYECGFIAVFLFVREIVGRIVRKA